MNELFKSRDIDKIYWVVVEQLPATTEGELVHFLKKNGQSNKSHVVSEKTTGAKRAELFYRHIASSDRYHLLEVKLATGRHHQIRVQLANIGCKVKGDVKYGARRANTDASIHLHARSISFIHPVSKEEVHVVAPLPKDPVWNAFANQ
jgi:23S rRNA pseudouridine1911/1915/1917 synthase